MTPRNAHCMQSYRFNPSQYHALHGLQSLFPHPFVEYLTKADPQILPSLAVESHDAVASDEMPYQRHQQRTIVLCTNSASEARPRLPYRGERRKLLERKR